MSRGTKFGPIIVAPSTPRSTNTSSAALRIAWSPAVLDSYVGKYDYGMGRAIMTVSREGNQLFAQLTAQPRFEIFPKSEKVFFWKVVAAQITFVKDAAGKVIKGIHEQGGQTKEVPKIE